MTEYHASEEDMKAYASLLRNLAALDFQRNQTIEALAAWEQAHRVEDAADVPADEPQ